MRYEWKTYQVGDLCTSVSETYKGKDEYVVLINTSDVLEGKILNHAFTKNANLKGQFKKTFQKEDILYSEIRPANKRFAFVDMEDTQNYIASTKLMVIRANPEIIMPEYLFIFLQTPAVIEELQLLAETRSGTFPQITFSTEIASLNISLPDKETQSRIVQIFRSFDDKIKLNNKINENLEQQVYALFESWFVSFDKTEGMIPNDWNQGTLKEIASITSGKRPPMKQAFSTAEIKTPLVGAASIMGYTNAVLYNEPILVTGRVGTHGVVQRFQTPCWASDNTLVIKSNFYEYTYQVLRRIDYANMNRGSTQPLITQTDLKNASIILPPESILFEFEKIAGNLMAKHTANRKENERLIALRNILLPKLLSGEIHV